MKKSKIIIAFVLLFVMLLIPITTKAETVQTGKFNYMPAYEDMAEETYYYSDDYFKQSGKEDNEHLLAMSMNLAVSTFEIRNYTYSRALLEDIGFEDIKAEDMEEKPTLDTIGTVMAHKEIDGKNLLVVAIRGEKYDSEWGNNFIVGKEGNAKGFDDTSKKVISRIKDYIDDNDLKNLKIWMVGYSRAGTVADLTGVYINKHLSEFKTKADDLYIYTFEPPAASIDDTKYDNIYVVKNVNDLIPEVYPSKWGFHTNGKVIEIGENETITTYTGLTNQTEYADEEMSEFYGEFFGWLTGRLSRETYSENLEEPVSKLLDIYFSKSTEDREKIKNFFMEDVKAELLDNQDNFGKLVGKAWAVMGHNSDYLYHSIADDIIEIMNGVKSTPNGSVLTDEEYETLINSIYPILRVLGPIIIDDVNYYDGIDYDEYYTNMAEDYLLTNEEMGTKSGLDLGKSYGYNAGFHDEPKDENSYETGSEYGPIYDEAYKNAYISAYLEYYELGQIHKDDLAAKGRYDGAKYSYNAGYDAGSHGEESVPYDEYFWEEDWMTEEYINAYNEAYEEEYLKGYEDGLKNPASDEDSDEYEQKNLYHLASLIKNISGVMERHYPQTNLKLVHGLDSYYKPYDLTEGANQTINTSGEDVKVLTIKTSGHLEKLVKVQVDNEDLDEENYELASGSTILTLKPEYLKTLSEGEHTLKLVYIDNTIETKFTISTSSDNQENGGSEQGSNSQNQNSESGKPDSTTINNISKDDIPDGKKDNPKTGDDIQMYIIFAILGAMGLVASFVVKE